MHTISVLVQQCLRARFVEELVAGKKSPARRKMTLKAEVKLAISFFIPIFY